MPSPRPREHPRTKLCTRAAAASPTAPVTAEPRVVAGSKGCAGAAELREGIQASRRRPWRCQPRFRLLRIEVTAARGPRGAPGSDRTEARAPRRLPPRASLGPRGLLTSESLRWLRLNSRALPPGRRPPPTRGAPDAGCGVAGDGGGGGWGCLLFMISGPGAPAAGSILAAPHPQQFADTMLVSTLAIFPV